MALWEDEEETTKLTGEKGEYCELCGNTGKWIHLYKCPMCFKHFCEACRYSFGGKEFCSATCGNEFFWGSDDSEDE